MHSVTQLPQLITIHSEKGLEPGQRRSVKLEVPGTTRLDMCDIWARAGETATFQKITQWETFLEFEVRSNALTVELFGRPSLGGLFRTTLGTTLSLKQDSLTQQIINANISVDTRGGDYLQSGDNTGPEFRLSPAPGPPELWEPKVEPNVQWTPWESHAPLRWRWDSSDGQSTTVLRSGPQDGTPGFEVVVAVVGELRVGRLHLSETEKGSHWNLGWVPRSLDPSLSGIDAEQLTEPDYRRARQWMSRHVGNLIVGEQGLAFELASDGGGTVAELRPKGNRAELVVRWGPHSDGLVIRGPFKEVGEHEFYWFWAERAGREPGLPDRYYLWFRVSPKKYANGLSGLFGDTRQLGWRVRAGRFEIIDAKPPQGID